MERKWNLDQQIQQIYYTANQQADGGYELQNIYFFHFVFSFAVLQEAMSITRNEVHFEDNALKV